MSIFLAIIDLIKGVAWPFLIFGIALCFRKDFRELIKRLTEVSPTGAKFDSISSQRAENVLQTIDTQKLVEFEGMSRTAVMEEVEKSILRDVNLVEFEKRIPLLTRHLAQARLEVAFGRVYHFIFGSQIEGLRELKKAGGKVPLQDAHKFFDDVRENFQAFYEKSSFGEWFSYLSHSGFASIENDEVKLLPLGEEFLTYLNSRGLPNRYF